MAEFNRRAPARNVNFGVLGERKRSASAARKFGDARNRRLRERFGQALMSAMQTPSLQLLLLIVLGLCAGASEPILLWPHGAPGDVGELAEEADTTKETDQLVAGRRVIRLGNVSQPALTVFPAPAGRNTGAAVLVCPGGGYHILAMDLEGTEVVEWLNSIGVTGVLLKYRVPARPGRKRHEAPLEDAQRAMGLIRHRAGEWGIEVNRIGVLGFSAGGHLAALLSGCDQGRAYERIDAADEKSCRPDFALVIYPGYLTSRTQTDELSPELKVTSATPPTFLVQTQDDSVPVESSLFYYLALRRAKVPAELHLYPTGGHGYGLRRTEEAVTDWPQLAARWFEARGLLKQQRGGD